MSVQKLVNYVDKNITAVNEGKPSYKKAKDNERNHNSKFSAILSETED